MLSVLPGVQTGGIGSRLLQYGENFAREQQCNSITITVIDKRDELVAWYRRKGFVPTGTLIPFSNKSSAALSSFSLMEMRKDLI
jgi:GNAT superfamily N-acetyltransferase